jgi:hypothetical protein
VSRLLHRMTRVTFRDTGVCNDYISEIAKLLREITLSVEERSIQYVDSFGRMYTSPLSVECRDEIIALQDDSPVLAKSNEISRLRRVLAEIVDNAKSPNYSLIDAVVSARAALGSAK